VQTSSSPSVLEASPAATVHLQTSSSPSVMHSSLPVAAIVKLATIDASILHLSPAAIAVNALIVPISNTHQVIFLKLTNTNYLY
jgi:hypothetical protein